MSQLSEFCLWFCCVLFPQYACFLCLVCVLVSKFTFLFYFVSLGLCCAVFSFYLFVAFLLLCSVVICTCCNLLLSLCVYIVSVFSCVSCHVLPLVPLLCAFPSRFLFMPSSSQVRFQQVWSLCRWLLTSPALCYTLANKTQV